MVNGLVRSAFLLFLSTQSALFNLPLSSIHTYSYKYFFYWMEGTAHDFNLVKNEQSNIFKKKCFYCFVMLCMSNSMKSFLKIMAIRSFFSVLGNLGDWKFKGNRLWANKRYYNFHYGKRQEFEFIKFLEYSFQRVFLPASV